MIRSILGLRINPDPGRSPRDQVREAAQIGAKGVVLDAAGDLAPDRLSETGRRDLRNLLRSSELTLIALHLPTRRPFDSEDGLDDRLSRADRAFALAYELGARLVLARVGGVPGETEVLRRSAWLHSLTELGKRGDHRGIRFCVESGSEPGSDLRAALDSIASPGLAASLDPGTLLRHGYDPVASTLSLGPQIAHAYATDATGPSGRPLIAHRRGMGLPAGALDWPDYLGALEEVDYRGFLTIWPDPSSDPLVEFKTVADRLKRF